MLLVRYVVGEYLTPSVPLSNSAQERVLLERGKPPGYVRCLGWPDDLCDEEIHERLLGLNLERAEIRELED